MLLWDGLPNVVYIKIQFSDLHHITNQQQSKKVVTFLTSYSTAVGSAPIFKTRFSKSSRGTADLLRARVR